LYRLMHPRSTRWFDTKGKTIIKPLAHEIDDEHLQYYPSTTTVTHFSLKGSVRIEEVIERLRLRTKAIISKNPWLASRLVVVKGQTVMAHPAEVKDFDLGTYFQCLDHIDPKFESLSMDSGRVKLEDYLRVVPLVEAGKGIQLLEKDLPMFKINVLRDPKSPEKRFAMFVSMCHILGDGYTFYSIHNMLSTASEIKAFEGQRPAKAIELMNDTIGKEQAHYKSFFPALALYEVKKALFGADIQTRHFSVDKTFIAKCKAEHLEKVKGDEDLKKSSPFISTNDILTSLSLNVIRPHVAMMEVNMRGRVSASEADAPTAHHAGNYVKDIFFNRGDYEDPSLIRKSVGQLRRAGNPEKPLPGVWDWLCSPGRVCMITNWLSFMQPVDLDGCEQIVHMPLEGEDVCNDLCTGAIIYRPRRDEIAIALIAPSLDKMLEKVSDEEKLALRLDSPLIS